MKNEVNSEIDKLHGCKRPDGCYIDKKNKFIFILEMKNQDGDGSVCEKLQTAGVKRENYKEIFDNKYDIIYIFVLGDWFKTKVPAELKYLKKINIPVFWGNDENYKSDIINFIVNYK